MTQQPTREQVRSMLARTRGALADAIGAHSDEQLTAQAVTSEWSALDILRHIAVWGELAARCLRDWHGSRDWILTFASEDQFNQEMVGARAGWDRATIMAAIDDAYGAYAAALEHMSDAELAEQAAAPWGQHMSRLQLIYDSLGHDGQHIGELRGALAAAAR